MTRPSGNRYFCRQCGRRQRAELPPAGWLRVQVADPDLARRRAAGWSATDAGGLFCGLPCLIAWAGDQAPNVPLNSVERRGEESAAKAAKVTEVAS
jgi:hypothetical protein